MPLSFLHVGIERVQVLVGLREALVVGGVDAPVQHALQPA
jgi:hypothetical protein